MSTVVIRRPPRRSAPSLPRGELLLESPPELPDPEPPGVGRLIAVLPPLLAIAALAVLYAAGHTGPTFYLADALIAGSAIAMVVALSSTRRGRHADLAHERRDYMRYLAQARRQTRRAAAQQRAALAWLHPRPEALWSLVPTPRLWERRPTDDDFGQVRLAVGQQQIAIKLVTPETKPVEDLEPMAAVALRRFVRAHSSVDDLPIALALRAFTQIVVRAADPDAGRALVRAMLCQLAVMHSPVDLIVMVAAAPERQGYWDWVKWLPHAQHPSFVDGAGSTRLVAADLYTLERLLGAELDGRPRFSPNARPLTTAPHIVVVLDGGEVHADSPFAGPGLIGTTRIDLSGAVPRGSGRWLLCLELTEDSIRVNRGNNDVLLGRPDRLSLVEAGAVARALAPYRLSPVAADTDPLAQGTGLLQLLDIEDPAAIEPRDMWRPRPERDQLRIPIGVGVDGQAVGLDLKEAALDGMGPHGLLIGATGSGKSELLRSIVTGLAITHSPESINFVLIDFKGGATFSGMQRLPHTSALITNLAADLPMVDRMRDALVGEMIRRQELLKAAGKLANRREYERHRLAGTPLEPMPSLLIVCDEFSEMLSAKPDFIDLFVQIGRIGRSIGVHLLLASQRLEEGRLRGLDTHLSYRIGLRTFSAVESRIVLGAPDAYELPAAPGHGYLKFDTSTMVRFRGAHVFGPYPPVDPAPSASPAHGEVVPFHAGFQPLPLPAVPQDVSVVPRHVSVVPTGHADKDDRERRSVLDIVVERLAGQGRPAHQVWLPPLAEPPTLDQLLGPVSASLARGLHATNWPGAQLRVPVGIVDRPLDQRRDPLVVDLAGAGGSVAIVGGPQAGKSTLLRSLLVALALTHTPEEVQFFCLDFGGGSLLTLGELPHVSGVNGRLHAESVTRTVAEVEGILDEREARFVALGVDSMAHYRRRRATGEIDDDPFGDIFLVIDGWNVVRQEYPDLELAVVNLCSRGLTFGIHVVLSASRWAEIRPAMTDMLGTRLELRLGDPMESAIDRRAAADVPATAPGRGMTAERLHFLSAISRLDGLSTVDDLTAATQDVVGQIAAAWPKNRAPAVRLLPTLLTLSELKTLADPEAPGLPIGVNESRLDPVYLDDQHLIVLGDRECGKTNLLRLVARSLVARYSPEQVRLVIVDYRRGLLGAVEGDHLLAYLPSPGTLRETMPSMQSAIANRLPGPDVTGQQLRERSWWRGPELYLLVDDYDLVSGAQNPLADLLDLIVQAADIGLHLIVTRRVGGASRALFDPVLQRLREIGTPALIMSGHREEGTLFGVRPAPLPPGRGFLVQRDDGTQLVQTAWEGTR